MTTYFAYGSNMRQSQIVRDCPGFGFVGTGRLPNYRLAFTRFAQRWSCGVADIVKHDDSEVWGVLYSLTPDDVKRLDRREGVPKAYDQIQVTIGTSEGNQLPVMTYAVVTKAPEEIPSNANYMNEVLAGAREHKLPSEYIEELEATAARFGV